MEKLIKKHGGYRKLKTYQLSQLVFDITLRFCNKFIGTKSRTHDQMVQAARSGVQNIAEGSQASATSKKTELKLTNVSRASLEELKGDYEAFLRQNELKEWSYNDPKRKDLVDKRLNTADEFARWVNEQSNGDNTEIAAIAANGALVLIHVACALLNRQIASLAKTFEEEGGFTERLYKVRKNRQEQQSNKKDNNGQWT